MRTDFIALDCIVPNRNLHGLPEHLNGHPRVSEQNLLPQNMVWRTREASPPPGHRTLEGLPNTNSTPPNPTPRRNAHHKRGGAASQTIWGVGRGRGARGHTYLYMFVHVYDYIYIHVCLWLCLYRHRKIYVYAHSCN